MLPDAKSTSMDTELMALPAFGSACGRNSAEAALAGRLV